ncbi:MAG: nuclear transport factor 2 family protein [Saprospiraceae bacterium]
MSIKLTFSLLLSLATLLASCQKKVENKEINSQRVIEQVKNQVNAFYAADTSLNAQKLVDLIWPEFTMLVDGNRIGYQDVKTGTKTFMASLEVFHTEWKDLQIVPLDHSHAISSFIFTDSLVAKDGKITQSTGPNTFVWEKRKEEWKVIYGDADHYPIK